MRHKYAITLNHEKQEVTLQEFTDVDKDTFSLICEVTYKNSIIEFAAGQGTEALVHALRTTNFFPCGLFAEQIAQSVMNLYGAGGDTYAEVFCDDLIPQDQEKEEPDLEVADEIESTDDDSADIDGLLADDFDSKIKTSGIDKTINIDTTEAGGIGEEA